MAKIPVRVKRAGKRIQSRPTKKTVARKAMTPGSAVRVRPSRTTTYALVGIAAFAMLIGIPNLLQQSDSTIAATPSATSATATPPRSAQPSRAKAAAKPTQMSAVTSAPHSEPVTGTDTRSAAAAVTLSGCLQGGDDSFWLKDTEGADAPKARSWKSGFLTKRSASIQVVDGIDALNLSKYVGQRVAATGTLANRTMQARSLRRVAATCD
jgi:hypothetical protein